jgi:hypothetical protein
MINKINKFNKTQAAYQILIEWAPAASRQQASAVQPAIDVRLRAVCRSLDDTSYSLCLEWLQISLSSLEISSQPIAHSTMNLNDLGRLIHLTTCDDLSIWIEYKLYGLNTSELHKGHSCTLDAECSYA